MGDLSGIVCIGAGVRVTQKGWPRDGGGRKCRFSAPPGPSIVSLPDQISDCSLI